MNAASRAAMGESAMDNLVSAGAPELPAHHIYRIRQETHSDHVIRVEVRKLNERTGSYCLSWATFTVRDYAESLVTALVRACHEAYADPFPEGVPA